MKIGIVLSSLPSYSETFFISKIEGLQKCGFEVVLFVGYGNKNFNLCKVKSSAIQPNNLIRIFLRLFKVVVFRAKIVYKFYRLERKQKVPVGLIAKKIIQNLHVLNEKNLNWLHFGFATQAIGRENIANAMGAKMALSIRGFDIGIYPLKNPGCYDLLWEKIDKLHVISNDLLNLAYKNGLKKRTPYQKITPAIKTSFFKNESLKSPFEVHQIQLMTVGRLHWKKDYESILKALKHLKDWGIHYTYTIIGDGPDKEKLEYLVCEFNLIDRVVFAGKISQKEILHYFKKSNFYLQYSLQEGFCNAVLEAQAMGVLPIVSNAEGLSENVVNNQTGWVIPKNNPILLARKIMDVLNLPEIRKETMRKKAIIRVRKEFGENKQQQEFVNFYSKQSFP